MATKPSAPVTWATDPTLTAGIQAGETPRLEPSSGQKAQGNIPGQSAPGRWYNWLFGTLGEWTEYLDDLHNSVDFLNKSYTWITGSHTFSTTTAFLSNLTASGEYNYASAKIYVKAVPLSYGACDGGASPTWAKLSTNGEPQSLAAGIFEVPLTQLLPTEAIITRVVAAYEPGTAAAASMGLVSRGHGAAPATIDLTSTASLTSQALASDTSDGTTNAQLLDTGTISFSVSAQREFVVRFVAPAAGDKIRWLAVQYTVSGVRS